MARPSPWHIALAALVVLPVATWQAAQYLWYQHLLPAGVDAPLIEYRKSKAYGIGPGGKEAGLVVYRMSAETAQRIDRGGVGYLVAADAGRREGRQYWKWRRTPVEYDGRWTRHGEHSCGQEPGVGAYVDLFNFRCRVRPAVIAEVNRFAASPGALYAYGPSGSVVIVAPKARKVVLAYNG